MNSTSHYARGAAIAQLVVSIVSILSSIAGLFGVLVLLLLAPTIDSYTFSEIDQMRGILWILLLLVLLPIPSLGLSIRYLKGDKPSYVSPRLLLFASLFLLFVPLLILLGRWLSQTPVSGWLLPLVNILLVGIPLVWYVQLGSRRLSPMTTKRQWGLSVFSVYITLPVIIIVEVIIVGIGIVFAGLWLLQQPEFAPLLQQLTGGSFLDSLSIELPSIDWLPLVQRPEVIGFAVAGISLVVPLIEEALKPAAMWVLFKRLLSPVEGFIAGLVCGASFGLIESLFSLGSMMGDDWAFTAVGRIGTGLLHTLTAGLNGWAIASAWQDGKHLRVAVTYFLTVLIHGVWNLFALFMGLSQLGSEFPLPVNPVLASSSVWVLAAMFILMLAALFLFNRKLRQQAPPPLPPEIPAFIE